MVQTVGGKEPLFGRRTSRNTLFISACKIPRHQLLSAEIIQVKAHPGSSDQSDLIDACKNHSKNCSFLIIFVWL